MVIVVALHTAAVREPSAFAAGLAVVSTDRKERVLSFKRSDDRRLSLCAGLALGACLNTVGLSADTEIIRTEHGKPVLRDHPQWQFSLSHSGEYAVCALADAPIGIDVQERRSVDALSLAERFFSPMETELLRSLPETERSSAFFRLWTAKESILKAQGSGLTGGLARVPIVYGDELKAPPWRLKEYPLPGYALTACGTDGFPDLLTVISSFDSVLLH